ncbi:hypothetical protein ACHAWO_011152 [Cyclotella atomus]|uniref:Uncharacterized protein n=1 Tax=Cyclotella atomus TaxID=382360 RepID=A0ABD3QDR0_9STRA
MTALPWNETASPRRRRFVLQRYGRGPKKKPPDPVEELPSKSIKKPLLEMKVATSKRRIIGTRYKRPSTAIFHCNITNRAPAPFLAGRRYLYRRVSRYYWTKALSKLRQNGDRHGFIRHLFNKVSQGAQRHHSSHSTNT